MLFVAVSQANSALWESFCKLMAPEVEAGKILAAKNMEPKRFFVTEKRDRM